MFYKPHKYIDIMTDIVKYKERLSSTIIIIGRNIKRIRIEKHITQQQIAYLADNMERSTISNIECFNCDNITLKTLLRICIILDVKLEDIIKEQET